MGSELDKALDNSFSGQTLHDDICSTSKLRLESFRKLLDLFSVACGTVPSRIGDSQFRRALWELQVSRLDNSRSKNTSAQQSDVASPFLLSPAGSHCDILSCKLLGHSELGEAGRSLREAETPEKNWK